MTQKKKKGRGENRQTRKQELPNVVDFLNNEKALLICGGKVREAKGLVGLWGRKQLYVFSLFDRIRKTPRAVQLTFMLRKCTSGELVAIVLFNRLIDLHHYL